MSNFDKAKQDGMSGIAQKDYNMMRDIRDGKRDPKDLGAGMGTTGVRYTPVKDKILVEYGVRGNDVIFQVSPPKRDMKFWRNINNREIYERMFKIIDEYGKIPRKIKKDVVGPTPQSSRFQFDKITIIFYQLANAPFAMSHVKRAAEALASRLY